VSLEKPHDEFLAMGFESLVTSELADILEAKVREVASTEKTEKMMPLRDKNVFLLLPFQHSDSDFTWCRNRLSTVNALSFQSARIFYHYSRHPSRTRCGAWGHFQTWGE
jgi:hypothetical protein